MKELRDILRACEKTRREGGQAVLATIVDVSGSAYRGPGARMLILEGGETVGLLSGGCLEGDLAERAGSVLDSGDPRTVVYDMTTQEDLVWGLGLGCAGKVHVFLERVPGGPAEAFLEFVAGCLDRREPCAAGTLFEIDGATTPPPGTRLLLDAGGTSTGTTGHGDLDRALLDEMRRALESESTFVRRHPLKPGNARFLVESIPPPIPLVLFGGGPDAAPIVRLAKELGWCVTVVDHRPSHATAERFPEADEVVLTDAGDPCGGVTLDSRTVALVMTHRFLHDVELARRLVPSPVRYLGLLGPKARTEKILAELRDGGLRPSPEQLGRLYGPVGLDIGAEAPEEIALSALAEIRAVLAGRSGGSLRLRDDPLHDRDR